MASTQFQKPVPLSQVETPPTGYFGRFISDGSDVGLVANTQYFIGPGPARTTSALLSALSILRQELVVGAGPFTLTHAPSGLLTQFFADGVLQKTADYSIVGTTLTLLAIDPSNYANFTVIYAY